MSVFRLVCGIVPSFALLACGNQESPPVDEMAGRGADACQVLRQQEVDDLAGHALGTGRAQSLGNGIRQCGWPAQGVPELIVQLLPRGGGGVRAAAAVGEGFLVLDVPGMDTAAAVSVLNPGNGSGLSAHVGILALAAGDRILRIAPLKLDIVRNSEQYKALLGLAKTASSRLRQTDASKSEPPSVPAS